MLTVHHLGISQSDRVVWLCEELEIPYELVLHARDPVTRAAPESYRALHPFGTAPVIFDDDLVLGESGAILEYLMAKYSDGRLARTVADPDFATYLFWFHFANGSMMPSAMIQMVANRLSPGGEAKSFPMNERLVRAYAAVEQRLGEAPYFAGDAFTAADIMMMFPLTTTRLFSPYDISGMPNLLAYLQRIAARPAFQRAAKKGDPDLVQKLT